MVYKQTTGLEIVSDKSSARGRGDIVSYLQPVAQRHHGPLFIGSIQRLILRMRLANRPFHHKMKSYMQNVSVMRDAS
jgi:hypothetical protein